jgi:pyruvate dehydrogenase E2 component (dihydrolipoamide acetyltransferase)
LEAGALTVSDERISQVTMPKWGLSMTTGKIIEWLVAEGDQVTVGMDLAEIDTEKIAGALESTSDGVLHRIIAPAGAEVPVGGTIALVAPADVPDAAIEEVAAAAREQLASGVIEEVKGPAVSSVEVDGRSISYATLGDGDDVVVLVHGYGGDKNSWLFVQEPLARDRTVHALDLPGHGASSKDVGDGSLDTLARTVIGFLDALGVPPAHLVGHSLGGAVATAVAVARPDKVRSLTLVAPAGFGPDVDADYLRGFASATSRRELRPQVGKLFADDGQVTRQLVDDLLKYKRIDGVATALNALLATLLDGDRQALDVASLLTEVRVPTVVVWGRADEVLPASGADLVGGQARVQLVDDAGHMVHLEAPSAVVAAVESAAETAAKTEEG